MNKKREEELKTIIRGLTIMSDSDPEAEPAAPTYIQLHALQQALMELGYVIPEQERADALMHNTRCTIGCPVNHTHGTDIDQMFTEQYKVTLWAANQCQQKDEHTIFAPSILSKELIEELRLHITTRLLDEKHRHGFMPIMHDATARQAVATHVATILQRQQAPLSVAEQDFATRNACEHEMYFIPGNTITLVQNQPEYQALIQATAEAMYELGAHTPPRIIVCHSNFPQAVMAYDHDEKAYMLISDIVIKRFTQDELKYIVTHELQHDIQNEWSGYIAINAEHDADLWGVIATNPQIATSAEMKISQLDTLFDTDPQYAQWRMMAESEEFRQYCMDISQCRSSESHPLTKHPDASQTSQLLERLARPIMVTAAANDDCWEPAQQQYSS